MRFGPHPRPLSQEKLGEGGLAPSAFSGSPSLSFWERGLGGEGLLEVIAQ